MCSSVKELLWSGKTLGIASLLEVGAECLVKNPHSVYTWGATLFSVSIWSVSSSLQFLAFSWYRLVNSLRLVFPHQATDKFFEPRREGHDYERPTAR